MAFNYVVSAQRPTSVTHACAGKFTGPDDYNLVVAKSNYLEIFKITSDGLIPQFDVPFYATVSTMELYHPSTRTAKTDVLLITTERFQFCMLSYDCEKGRLVTLAQGNIKVGPFSYRSNVFQERIGRESEFGRFVMTDPRQRLIGLHIYDGLFKVIPLLREGVLGEAFNVRLEELIVIHTDFLHETEVPTICILCEDAKENRHVSTYEILIKEKEVRQGPFRKRNVDTGAHKLLPVPGYGGVLIVGETTLTYINAGDVVVVGDADCAGINVPFQTIPVEPMLAVGVGRIDNERYLVSLDSGELIVVLLEATAGKVTGLRFTKLGVATVANSVCYLDSGVVFLGSSRGDSQLVRLLTHPTASGTHFDVLETFSNLGPILDLAVMNLDWQTGQVVTCSGVGKDGSLRVVRNGIGIEEQALVELPGIRGIFSLRESQEALFDKYLLQSFVAETRILTIGDGGVISEETDGGFDYSVPTMFAHNMVGDVIVQVTAQAVHVLCAKTSAKFSTWIPDAGMTITIACGNESQLLLGLPGGLIVLLGVDTAANTLKELSRLQLEQEVACMDCTPFLLQSSDMDVEAEEHPPPRLATSTPFAAVGLWETGNIILLELPSLKKCSTVALQGDVLPRSLLFAVFEDPASLMEAGGATAQSAQPHLLAGLGDGRLAWFSVDPIAGELRDIRRVPLASEPIKLSLFLAPHSTTFTVFAASDRPTVIYPSRGKVQYSTVNIRNLTNMCPFNSEAKPGCLALSTPTDFMLGSIDSLQKLQVRTVPLNAQPRRIAHLENANAVLVCLEHQEMNHEGDIQEHCTLQLMDDQTFDALDEFLLEKSEVAFRCETCTFSEDETPLFVVGTAFVVDEEDEPTRGRILVISVEGTERPKLRVVLEKEVKGAVYSMCPFHGNLLCGIGSRVQLFKWRISGKEPSLNLECSHEGHILVLGLSYHGNTIVVGDLMKSMCLLEWTEEEGKLVEVARDVNSNWMLDVSMTDDVHAVGVEHYGNLFTVARNVDAAQDDVRKRLQICGEFHIGDHVNRIRRGALVTAVNDSSAMDAEGVRSASGEKDDRSLPTATYLFGCVSGAIGVIAPLSQPQFAFMTDLQEALRAVVRGVGGLTHQEYREFRNDRRSSPMRGFIDGDLVESFLDLIGQEQTRVLEVLNQKRGGRALPGLSLEQLTTHIDELRRLK